MCSEIWSLSLSCSTRSGFPYVGTGNFSQAEIWGHREAHFIFPFPERSQPCTVIHFLNTVASYILACFILVFGRIANLVPDILSWLEADQSWVLISKYSWRSFKDLLWAFLFYMVNFFLLLIEPILLKVLWVDLNSF